MLFTRFLITSPLLILALISTGAEHDQKQTAVISSEYQALSTRETTYEREGRIKAAAVYHLAKFTQWQVLPNKKLSLCVVGKDPLNSYIKKELSGKKIHSKKIEIKFLKNAQQLKPCNVLFIGAISEEEYQLALKATEDSHTLTISFDDREREGSVVHLRNRNNKLEIDRIDLTEAQKRNLDISSEVLMLAKELIGASEVTWISKLSKRGQRGIG